MLKYSTEMAFKQVMIFFFRVKKLITIFGYKSCGRVITKVRTTSIKILEMIYIST